MQVSLPQKVLLALGFLFSGLSATPAMAQWGPYGEGYGGWGAFPYAVSSQANNVSRQLAAGAHRETFNRAQQQTANMQRGIRDTLMASAQNRTAQMQNYTQNYENWTLQHQDRQMAQSRPPSRPFAPTPTATAAFSSSAVSAARASTSIIKWPVALLDPRFDKLRAEIEEPFRKQAVGGTPPTIEEYKTMIEAADEMKGLLTGIAFEISAAQYKELEKFLDTLAAEAQGRIDKRTESQPKEKSPKQAAEASEDNA